MARQVKSKIFSGYQPTLSERVTAMHVRFYGEHYGFGSVFKAKVATEMTEFISRIDHPNNQIWSFCYDDKIAGSIAIDGEDLSDGKAHLRWFIIDDMARGTGAGDQLLSAAMTFVDALEFKEIHLWTFKGLDAARRLYERVGFKLVQEKSGDQWGTKVKEQHFVRSLGANV